MKYFEDKDDLYSTIFSELKSMGVKVPKVKKFKSNISKQEKTLQQPKSKIFGVSLGEQEWTSDFDYLLPKFMASSTTYLQNYTKEVGIFRKAGSKVRQRELRLKLEKGEMLDGSEPNDVAALLKQWLRELPEPLIPQYMHDLFVRCQQLDNDNRITASLLACLLLPPDHLHTFKYLMCFLAEFAAKSDINMMGSHNLALIMAPNIFTSSTDTVDKSSYSNNLVQVHASVIQLLIENATKIGDVSEFASFQQSAQEGKSCSELDSSGDILDSSPYKGRKKQKNGHVQDLFSGIKKLVGQNATPGNNLKTPEKFWSTLISVPRSASKRKADPDQQSLSPLKKQAKSVNDQDDIFLSATPKDKDIQNFGTVGRSGRIRKKSFGLLRKKERKRHKSVNENSQPVVSINVISPENFNAESKNNVPLKSTRSSVDSISSVFENNSHKLSKCESIKKYTSDCYLAPKVKAQRLSLPSSQDCQTKFEISHCHLHPSKVVEENVKSPARKHGSLQLEVQNAFKVDEKIKKQKNLTQMYEMQIDTKTTLNNQVYLNKASKGTTISNKSPVKKESSPCPSRLELKNAEVCQKIPCDVSVNDKAVHNEKINYNTRASLSNLNHKSNTNSTKMSIEHPENTELRSISDSHIKRSSTKTSKRSPNERLSQKGLSRQEAFIVKPKKQIKNHSDQLENTEDKTEKIHKKTHVHRAIGIETGANPLRKSQSVTLDNKDKNKIKKKVTRKTSRKGSIIRGQPNTVKSGLRSELRGSESFLITSDFCEDKVFTNSSDKANKTIHPRHSYESCAVDVPEAIGNNISDPKDTSLNLKFENFTLSSPVSVSDNLMDFVNSMFSHEDNSSLKEKSEDVSKKIKSEKKLSIQSKSERTQDSKIPRLRNSLEVEKTNSFSDNTSEPKRKVSKSRASNSSDSSKSSSKIPVKCKENSLDISSLQVSMNDSCFKTPDRNNFLSPNSINWMSGSKYFGINSPQEDVYNKRESIALILKNNPGHVQAKVSMYDTRLRDSVFCTRSVPTFSTPFENSDSKKTLKSSGKHHSSSQKSHGKLYESKSYDSVDKINCSRSRRKSRRSPQPPPKFDINETIAPSTPNVSHPFKEVSSVSLGLNESSSLLNNISINNENSILKQSFNIHLSKENINTTGLSMSQTSANASMKDENILRKSPMENVSHPLKEVTNISFGLNESHNSLNNSSIKDESFILKQLSKSNINSKKTRKLKRNSFSANSPNKRSKKVFRSESSPGRRLRDKVSNHVQNSTTKSASIILERNNQNECFVSKSRVLRSSNAKSGNSQNIEKLRFNQLIDELDCEL